MHSDKNMSHRCLKNEFLLPAFRIKQQDSAKITWRQWLTYHPDALSFPFSIKLFSGHPSPKAHGTDFKAAPDVSISEIRHSKICSIAR